MTHPSPSIHDTFPTAQLEVDLNWDGDVDDEGENVFLSLVAVPDELGEWTFEHTVSEVPDDGRSDLPWPSNNTAFDPLSITVRVTDDDTLSHSDSETALVHNVAPTLIISAVTEVPDPNEEGRTLEVRVDGEIDDLGQLDRHEVTITWADGYAQSLLTDTRVSSPSLASSPATLRSPRRICIRRSWCSSMTTAVATTR